MSRRTAPTDVKPTLNFHPAGVHQRVMRLWREQEVEGQCFRTHPESYLLGTGILCPEQLGALAEFSHVASLARLPSEACRRTQGHASQESRVAAADPSQNAGSLQNDARPQDYHE